MKKLLFIIYAAISVNAIYTMDDETNHAGAQIGCDTLNESCDKLRERFEAQRKITDQAIANFRASMATLTNTETPQTPATPKHGEQKTDSAQEETSSHNFSPSATVSTQHRLLQRHTMTKSRSTGNIGLTVKDALPASRCVEAFGALPNHKYRAYILNLLATGLPKNVQIVVGHDMLKSGICAEEKPLDHETLTVRPLDANEFATVLATQKMLEKSIERSCLGNPLNNVLRECELEDPFQQSASATSQSNAHQPAPQVNASASQINTSAQQPQTWPQFAKSWCLIL